MKNLSQNIKILMIALVLGLGINYVFAWVGPTGTAPGNNKQVPLNVTVSDQEKGDDGVPDLSAKLDIDGRLGARNVLVTASSIIGDPVNQSGDLYITSLPGTNRLCVDVNHKLTITCPAGGGGGQVCGNNILEGAEQCDDGNTDNGDGCSSVCMNEAPGGSMVYVRLTPQENGGADPEYDGPYVCASPFPPCVNGSTNQAPGCTVTSFTVNDDGMKAEFFSDIAGTVPRNVAGLSFKLLTNVGDVPVSSGTYYDFYNPGAYFESFTDQYGPSSCDHQNNPLAPAFTVQNGAGASPQPYTIIP